MVTARQIGRGVARTMRAIERDAQRAQKQRLAYEKQRAKEAMLQRSADAAQAYERIVSILTRAHQKPFKRVDWASTASAASPRDPTRGDAREKRARQILSEYRPGWFTRMLGFDKPKRAKLQQAVSAAASSDEQAFENAVRDVAERRAEIAFAQRVLALDSAALEQAVNSKADFGEGAVEELRVQFAGDRTIVLIDVLGPEGLPTHSISLLQSGKASEKPLSPGKLSELHRDTVCSAAISSVAECLRVLPVDALEVVARTELLDRSTGHISAQPVFYARVTAQALSSVNLTMAEAYPLSERLGAHFDWNKRDGIRPINLAAFGVPETILMKDPA